MPGEQSTLSQEDQLAVSHFRNTHYCEADGSYVVSLPKRQPAPPLGRSRDIAMRRYLSNEKSLMQQGKWDAFNVAVSEYLTMDHAERVPPDNLGKPVCETFYLPMHGVVKDSSTTTKLSSMPQHWLLVERHSIAWSITSPPPNYHHQPFQAL